jgi:hypothetical protein
MGLESAPHIASGGTEQIFKHEWAAIASTDETIREQMVWIKSITVDKAKATKATVEDADWMRIKHLSADKISVHETVLASISLSQKSTRLTISENGGTAIMLTLQIAWHLT